MNSKNKKNYLLFAIFLIIFLGLIVFSNYFISLILLFLKFLILLLFNVLEILLSPLGLIISIFIFFKKKSKSYEKSKNDLVNSYDSNESSNKVNGIELRCVKCNSIVQVTDLTCPNCGESMSGDNIKVLENNDASVQIPEKQIIKSSDFGAIYSLPEKIMIETYIERELKKVNIDKSTSLIPNDVLKRRKLLNIIFSLLLFVYIVLIFFHFPIYTYLIGFIILFVFNKITKNFNIIKYLKKEITARPGEKISNIVMYEKNNLVEDNTRNLFIVEIMAAIILPLIIFSTPKILYEKMDGGYAVRYYAFGLSNFKTVVIPEEYKNEKIISLRGNTFSNMPFLEKVTLPNSIVEIRGQAFKNCVKLEEVNLPSNLEYLGGGAFYNAKSLKRIEFPDTLTYLGGESFYKASSLEYVKLSNNLLEIRGDTFEYCTSLESITIPDSVTRIGGHAFYGDTNLMDVEISMNSKLSEIGSSAFRQCSSLRSIKVPMSTYIDTKAFKESPTIVSRYY